MMQATVSNTISVVFPCFNEEGNIRRTVERTVEVLNTTDIDWEIIIVDDGSGDQTAVISDELARQNGRVRVLHHETNRGYGAALRSGFAAASKQLVFFMDSDGQFDIGEMPALLPLMETFDIVSCYRIDRRDPLTRKVNAWCWTQLVCHVFGMRIRDIDCAFKLCKKEMLGRLQMTSTGALISAELLARAIKKGYCVVQRPVHHYPRTAGTQTGAQLRVIVRAFKELLLLGRDIRRVSA